MLINTNMGSKDSGGVCESPPVHYKDFPTPQNFTSPQIPTPPPPPPPIQTLCEPPWGLLPRLDPKRCSRLRNFNWEAIPLEKVRGRSSLWSSETFQGDLQIDTGTMEKLFGKNEGEIVQRPYNARRSMSVGDVHGTKVFLLDSRRSMNIGILLKQFKRSAAQIVDDIGTGNVDLYSSERLSELMKHLPDREEVQRLTSFQGDRERLSEADMFMLLLLDVPSYGLRLETLILKKDFHPAIVSQLSAARELKAAAEELLQCSELHFILKLVLKAGNFMNAGGYAGNAAGFRVSSLLKLADTKANKPGMNLLHFVVMEVQKKDPKYLSFADTLKHVQGASRLSEESLLEEFEKLRSRVSTMQRNLAAQEQRELRGGMEEFLEYAAEQLQEVRREIEEFQSWKRNLVEFLCEDEDTFRLEECCRTFSCFCQKFQMAIKENKIRELEEQRHQQWERKRLQKRHSMAICSSLEAHQAVDELELTLERNLQNLCRTSSVRLCRMRSFGSHSPNPFAPQREQRERIQVYCDQKNAEQMREMSERVLRQQMEYKSSKTPNPGNKASFYPASKIPMNPYCQAAAKADNERSLPIDRTEIEEMGPPEIEEMGPPEIEEMGPPEIEEMGSPEIEEMGPPEIEEMGPPELEEMEPPEIEEMGPPEIEEMGPPEIEEMEPPEIEGMEPPEIEEMGPPEIEEMEPPEIEGMGPPEIEEMGPPEIEEMGPPEIEEIEPPEIEEMEPPEIEEMGPPEIEEKGLPEKAITHPLRGVNQQNVGRLRDQYHYRPTLVHSSSSASTCPARCVTMAEIDTQKEIIEQSRLSCQPLDHAGLLGQSKPFLEAAKPRQPYHIITLERPGINTQSPIHCTCEPPLGQSKASSQLLTHPETEIHCQVPLTSGPKAPRQGLLSQYKCVAVTEQPIAGLKNTKDFLVHHGPETQSWQPRTQWKVPPYPSGSETFKPIPTPSHSQNLTQSSMKPFPEGSLTIKSNGQMLYQQGRKTWNKQRDLSNTQIPKQLPIKQKDANTSQTRDQSAVDFLDLEPLSVSAPGASQLSDRIISGTHNERPLTSSTLKTKQGPSGRDASIPSVDHPDSETLSWPVRVSEDQQRSPSSLRAFNQRTLQNVRQTLAPRVSTSSTETLTPYESETLPHTLIHLHPESLREDDSPQQSALNIPKQYMVKSFKQTLIKPSSKTTRQTVAPPVPPTSSPSLVQTSSETCNPTQPLSKAELPRMPQSKPGCFMTRIKHVEHLSIKQPAKDINGQVPPPPLNVVEPQHDVQPQDEYNHYAKGLRDAHVPVHRETPNHCSKWKRELRKASETADSCRVELKVENGNEELDKDRTEQKTSDNPKNPAPGRSSISKKLKKELGIKRALQNKDIPSGAISSSATKPPGSTKPVNTETRESKLPQKVSAGSLKPPSAKTTGAFKEKREIPRPSGSDSAKSERKNSPMMSSGLPAASTESPGHGAEPAWPSKKTNSVARVAVHVIKHHEVNSTLTRGSTRSPNLTTHPVWR